MTDQSKATETPRGETEEPRALRKLDELDLPSDAVSLAHVFAASGYFPDTRKASQAVVKIMAGRELGFGPFASMLGIYIIETRRGLHVQLSAKLMATLVKRSRRYDYAVVRLDETQCVLEFLEGGKVIGRSKFTLDDAKRAGIAAGDTWQHYPRNMLFNRALTNGVKWFCPQVLAALDLPIAAEAAAVARDDELEPGDLIIESVARDVAPAPTEVEDGVPTVTGPPEGLPTEPNWSRFWTRAKADYGLDERTVHDLFAVPEGEGELLAYARARAESQGEPLPQVVAEMEDELPERMAQAGLREPSLPLEQPPLTERQQEPFL